MHMGKKLDLTGKKFSRLTCLERVNSKWRCKCECGNYTIVRVGSLRSGTTKSCGCLHKSSSGLSETKEWLAWKNMLDRCYRKTRDNFKDYGGRGITVSKDWLSFNSFIRDMGFAPSKEYTLDRIDNNGNYSKSNCRWALNSTQQGNTRRSIRIKYKGKTQCLKEWCRELNLKYTTTKWRYMRGWGIKNVLTP